jgi:hypothetical protein
MSVEIDLNSIVQVKELSLDSFFKFLIQQNLPLKSIIDALLANLSQKNDGELLTIIRQSKLVVEILTLFKELVLPGVIEDLDVSDLIRQNFSSLQQGQQHLFAVLAFLQLLRSSGDAETPEEAEEVSKTIENLKELFRLTLFNSQIAIQLMDLRDEKQELVSRCPCLNCNARFILSIGWYIAAQEAHDKNMFVANLC